jgi:hypothetical protein
MILEMSCNTNKHTIIQYVRKVTVHLGYRYVDLVVSIEVAVEVCYCVTFHCVQLLNSG